MDIPKYKGKNLQTSISNENVKIEDPSDPIDKYIQSDKAVMNLEDMA